MKNFTHFFFFFFFFATCKIQSNTKRNKYQLENETNAKLATTIINKTERVIKGLEGKNKNKKLKNKNGCIKKNIWRIKTRKYWKKTKI